MQIRPKKSNTVYKKRGLQASLQGKINMSDDFKLGGEDEMEPTSNVTFSTSLRKVWDAQQKQAFLFMKQIIFFKSQIVSLDKTLIHRLVSFIALWICTETVILTFNRLESIEVHYMDTNPGMFSSKTLIYFRPKK